MTPLRSPRKWLDAVPSLRRLRVYRVLLLASCVFAALWAVPRHQAEPNIRAWRFVVHPVDTRVGESDGLSLYDLSGDGIPDPVSATGVSGAVYWYERDGSIWRRYLAAQGFVKAEGSAVADLDGDGRPEIITVDQGRIDTPGRLYLSAMATDDPRGAWTTVTLDEEVPFAQRAVVLDVDRDARLDVVLAYEGKGPHDGGFAW
jgi:hypothetical protein